MDNIESAINSIKDLFITKLDALTGSVKNLENKLDELEKGRSIDHDEIIRVQAKIEQVVDNLRSHENREKDFGISQNTRIDKLEEKVQYLTLKVVGWSGSIGAVLYIIEKFVIK